MSNHPNDPAGERPGDETEDRAAPGVEVGSSEGEGSTFEPEEDPEGQTS